MANTTSGTAVFDKNFSIDEIIEEAYERIGQQPMSGQEMKSARRIIKYFYFKNGLIEVLHYWEVR